MHHQTLLGPSLQAVLRCSLFFSLSMSSSFALAQASVSEQALTQTANDAQLKWGPALRGFNQLFSTRTS